MEWRCSTASSTRSLNNESREKLVWGKELYVDSTQVNANADLDSLTPRFALEAREAMQAHLAALFAREDAQHEQQEASVDSADTPRGEATATQVMACPVPTPLPSTLSEAEREELAQETAVRHDWIAEQGRPKREVRGYYQRTSDLRISTTDPDATPMRLKGGGSHLGYHVHYVVDGGKVRIILQVLVTPSEVMDNQPMRDLIFRTRFRWKLRPRYVTGDTKYGPIENIKALEDAGVRAYVPYRIGNTRGPISDPLSLAMTPSMTAISAQTANCCTFLVWSTQGRRQSTAPRLPLVLLVHSKRSVPPVIKVVRYIGPSMPATSNESGATTRQKPTRKR
jgi:hypothetical protein